MNMIIEAFKEDENVSHHLKEVHEYTMALPEEYWGPGSYDNGSCWMGVEKHGRKAIHYLA